MSDNIVGQTTPNVVVSTQSNPASTATTEQDKLKLLFYGSLYPGLICEFSFRLAFPQPGGVSIPIPLISSSSPLSDKELSHRDKFNQAQFDITILPDPVTAGDVHDVKPKKKRYTSTMELPTSNSCMSNNGFTMTKQTVIILNHKSISDVLTRISGILTN